MPKFGVKKGQSYVVKDYRHKKNMRLHLAKKPTFVFQQVVTRSNRNEFEKKKVQFATLFQILSDGRSLVEYESRHELYNFLNVPNN